MNKTDIRSLIIKKRGNLSKEFLDSASSDVVKNLMGSGVLESFDKILVYIPIAGEVDTTGLVSELGKTGKHLFLPANNGRGWVICKYSPGEELVKRANGVSQPKKLVESTAFGLDVVILPGLAFSSTGARVGFGLGVYDKLLAGLSIYKVGLCFDFQIRDDIRSESHDVSVDCLVSESGVLKLLNNDSVW